MLSAVRCSTAAFAVWCAAASVCAQDLSRHCTPVDDAYSFFRDGSYEGTWRIRMTFSQAVASGPMTQTITGEGTFTLTVDGTPLPDGRRKDLSTFKGRMKTSTTMSWSPRALQASQSLAGEATLTEDRSTGNAREGNFLKVKGSHRTAGTITATSPYGGGSRGQEFQDSVDFELRAIGGDCMGAHGTMSSKSLTSMADMMRSSGFTADFTSSWEMHRTDDLAARLEKLRQDIERPAPENLHRTRDGEANRLAALGDGIGSAPPSLQDCLFQVWKEGVRKIYGRWVAQDADALAAFGLVGKGSTASRVYNANSWAGLERLVRQAIDSDRALSLMGLDSCTEAEHNRLWEQIRVRMSDYLDKMASAQAPIVDLLRVLNSAELMGNVSPALREKTFEALRRLARQKADVTWAALVAEYTRAGRQADAPAVVEARRLALAAEKAAQVVGVDLERAVNFPASIAGGRGGQGADPSGTVAAARPDAGNRRRDP